MTAALLTKWLLGIRGVFTAAPAVTIVGHGAAELAVAAGWMTVALLTFNRLAAQGRLDGSLDHGE